MQKKNYQEEILNLIHSGLPQQELAERLSDYHENDLADALAALTPDERQKLYAVLGVERVAEIFSYLDDAEPYLKELPSEKAAKVVSNMDSDDAVDVLDDLEEEDKDKIVKQLDQDSAEDVRMLLSYGEDEIGSSMTTNYICIRKDMTIRQAMSELVKQAGENDNISTLYVVDEEDKFYGAIDLKDLIIARADEKLEKLIARNYPYVTDHEKISDCIDRIVDYAERSLPVLNDAGKLVGIITSSDVVELVDDEMGDDYAKLGGLTSEEDLSEGVFESVKKRLPWLIALLFLGMLVSSVVGAFESVVAVLPVVICFQSMVLDMAGNVGTQSLAVTIRVLVDENLTPAKKLQLLWKEMRVGLVNGLLLAVMALGFLGCYIHFFKAYAWGEAFLLSGCVGVALIIGSGGVQGGGSDVRGIGFGVSAAVFYATVILLNKYITGVPALERTFVQFLAAILVLTPYVALTSGFHPGVMSAAGWVNLLIVGLVHTGLTYCMYFSAIRTLPGQESSLLSYIDPIVSVLVSVLLLGEPLAPVQIVGIVLFLGFAIVNELTHKNAETT